MKKKSFHFFQNFSLNHSAHGPFTLVVPLFLLFISLSFPLSPPQSKMRSLFLTLLILGLSYNFIQAQTNCHGSLPTQGIYTGAPVLVNQTTNGKLYTVGGSENPLNILHVYGTPYEMGLATGQLLKKNILSMYSQFFSFMESEADPVCIFLYFYSLIVLLLFYYS